MTRSASPLLRACVALRLPRGLYCLRGDLPLSDAEIRANLRQRHIGAERLVLALTDVLAGPDLALEEPITDVWQIAAAVVKERDLPASMVGALAFAAMLPEEGALDPDEWGLFCEAAP